MSIVRILLRFGEAGTRRTEAVRKLEIYEPSLCCPTGVCGPAPDPALANLLENILRWKKKGIVVERLAINQAPQRFMANRTVVDLLTREGQEVLPISLLDGKVVCKGKYPTDEQVVGEGK
jgi:hypothetical protein